MQSTIRNQELNNEWRVRHRSDFSINFAHRCLGLRFTLTHLIIDKITCAITNTARMPPTDIIHVAMWIYVTLLVCDGCVKCVFFIRSLRASSKRKLKCTLQLYIECYLIHQGKITLYKIVLFHFPCHIEIHCLSKNGSNLFNTPSVCGAYLNTALWRFNAHTEKCTNAIDYLWLAHFFVLNLIELQTWTLRQSLNHLPMVHSAFL